MNDFLDTPASPSKAIFPEARILVIDDEEMNIRLARRLLSHAGYKNVTATTDSSLGVGLFDEIGPDLVMLDLQMPHPDGFAIMEALRARIPENAYLPVLVVSGEFSTESKSRAFSSVAKDFVAKPFDAIEVLLRVGNLLQTRHLHLMVQQQNSRLEVMVADRTRALEHAQAETLRRLAQAAEFRDDETGQHTRRVGTLAATIAAELGLPEETVELLRHAAPLHDVGKIGVPDSVLLKEGPLTETELRAMRAHTRIGANLLADGYSALSALAEEIALSHHERWDGTGYPQELAGEEIPLAARIVAVADFYDALSSDRPYRRAWAEEDILRKIEEDSGGHFDPRVVEAFLRACGNGAIRSAIRP